eukprot:3850894-Amphidinium_carterae.1
MFLAQKSDKTLCLVQYCQLGTSLLGQFRMQQQLNAEKPRKPPAKALRSLCGFLCWICLDDIHRVNVVGDFGVLGCESIA